MTELTKNRMRDKVSDPLDRARRVLLERYMRSRLIKVKGIFRKDSAKMLRVQHDQMTHYVPVPWGVNPQPLL